VTFVSPGGPAESAGFRKGDEIVALSDIPAASCSDLALIAPRFADSGTRFSFTMKDGETRWVQASDFF
jgi:S1-C subfamily serine protease